MSVMFIEKPVVMVLLMMSQEIQSKPLNIYNMTLQSTLRVPSHDGSYFELCTRCVWVQIVRYTYLAISCSIPNSLVGYCFTLSGFQQQHKFYLLKMRSTHIPLVVGLTISQTYHQPISYDGPLSRRGSRIAVYALGLADGKSLLSKFVADGQSKAGLMVSRYG